MSGYTKVAILLKDASNHVNYNQRIIEYLTDRHVSINDNKFTIAIEVVDDKNIDEYVRNGLESVPAMKVSNDESYIYGVNSILSMLSKLEIVENYQVKSATGKPSSEASSTTQETGTVNAFYQMALEEMKSEDPDDPDTPSTVKAYQQDFSESPLTDKMIEENAQAYNKIYEERNRRNKAGGVGRAKSAFKPNPSNAKSNINVDNIIQSGGYDKDEERLMRQIASNL